MNMNQLLESIYATNASDSSLEKTAEQAFLGGIDINPETPVAENPFSEMSLDELVKLAKDLEAAEEDSSDLEEDIEDSPEATDSEEDESEEVVEEVLDDTEDDLNKTAAAMFGGQLMAHAVVHELGLIKEAVANGICRVCKESPMDIEGHSVCTACSGGDNVDA